MFRRTEGWSLVPLEVLYLMIVHVNFECEGLIKLYLEYVNLEFSILLILHSTLSKVTKGLFSLPF